MIVRRTSIRHTAQAIFAAALGAALLAGPASAGPVHDGPLPHTDQLGTPHPALIADVSPTRFHDSIASSATAAPAYHDSIATTSSASGSEPRIPGNAARIAPPTLVGSASQDFAATTHAGPTGSDVPWAAIGAGLLLAALGTVGIVALGRRSHTPRRRVTQGTPRFGA